MSRLAHTQLEGRFTVETMQGLVFVASEPLSPIDRKSWRRFGTAGPSCSFLYRLFDMNRRLLYVGVTWNPAFRWGRHAVQRHWWNEVVHVHLEHGLDRPAYKAETFVIKNEGPLYNIHQAVRV